MKGFFEITAQDLDSALSCFNLETFVNEIKSGNEAQVMGFSLIKEMFHLLFQEVYIHAQFKVLRHDISVTPCEESEFRILNTDSKSYVKSCEELTQDLANKNAIRIFCGPAASSFMRCSIDWQQVLNSGVGICQIGQISGIGVFRAPVDVIPNDVIYVETESSLEKITLRNLRGI